MDEELDSDEQKTLAEQVPTATMDGAGVTTCTCGRTYSKRKNYIRYVKLSPDPSVVILYQQNLSFLFLIAGTLRLNVAKSRALRASTKIVHPVSNERTISSVT